MGTTGLGPAQTFGMGVAGAGPVGGGARGAGRRGLGRGGPQEATENRTITITTRSDSDMILLAASEEE